MVHWRAWEWTTSPDNSLKHWYTSRHLPSSQKSKSPRAYLPSTVENFTKDEMPLRLAICPTGRLQCLSCTASSQTCRLLSRSTWYTRLLAQNLQEFEPSLKDLPSTWFRESCFLRESAFSLNDGCHPVFLYDFRGSISCQTKLCLLFFPFGHLYLVGLMANTSHLKL